MRKDRKSSVELGHVRVLTNGNRIPGLRLMIRVAIWEKLPKNKAGPDTGRQLV